MNTIRLLYVGQISLRKGLTFLYQAVKGLNVEVRLFGPVVEPSLLQNLPSNVSYCGVAPHTQVAAEMSQADCFVFPTLEDACPLVILEAAGCGLPVISTTAAGSTESLDERDCTLVPPGSASSLRAAISNVEPLLSTDRLERADRIRRRAAQSGGEINDWSGWASQTMNAIEQKVDALRK
jgi:glycosyltransferase involved in cell wall biosynthesis